MVTCRPAVPSSRSSTLTRLLTLVRFVLLLIGGGTAPSGRLLACIWLEGHPSVSYRASNIGIIINNILIWVCLSVWLFHHFLLGLGFIMRCLPLHYHYLVLRIGWRGIHLAHHFQFDLASLHNVRSQELLAWLFTVSRSQTSILFIRIGRMRIKCSLWLLLNLLLLFIKLVGVFIRYFSFSTSTSLGLRPYLELVYF